MILVEVDFDLHLKPGQTAVALIKATEVMILRGD
jgi:molybdopterin-binding protein